jgi:hypothetical protein
MKKLLLCTLALAAFNGLKAQDHYLFSTRTANYVEMTNGTEVSQDAEWDDFSTGVTLPFAFEYFGVSVDSLFINDDGIFFTELAPDYVMYIGEDVLARGAGQSPVTYRVDGSPNNRILKIQWPNIAFFSTVDDFPNDFANYQIWLYEGSNVIEFHYGSSFISAMAEPDLELLPNMTSIDGLKWISVGGTPPNYVESYSEVNITPLTKTPPVNTIFVFTPGSPNSVKEAVSENQVNLYPVPAGAKLTVESKMAMQQIQIYNAAGQEVYTHEISGNRAEIATDLLPAGVYFVRVHTAEGVVSRKFNK